MSSGLFRVRIDYGTLNTLDIWLDQRLVIRKNTQRTKYREQCTYRPTYIHSPEVIKRG
jgi:hypothetical protein